MLDTVAQILTIHFLEETEHTDTFCLNRYDWKLQVNAQYVFMKERIE